MIPKLVLLSVALVPSLAAARPITVSDLMAVRTVVDVRISPDGERVAYVLSKASLDKNEHTATLYVVLSAGGPSRRLTYWTRLFNRPVPRPELRWSPDGERLSFLAWVSDFPQVLAMDAEGGEPRPLTSSPTGVSRYEWSKDGTRLAYVAAEPEPAEETREKQEKTFVIHAGRPGRPTRLFVQDVSGGAPRALSPPEHYVSSLDWSPDSKTLVYSASAAGEYLENWRSRLFTVPAEGGEPTVLVGRDGMNSEPQFSPDGRLVAFTSTGGVPRMISSPGLHVVSASGGDPHPLAGKDTWVREVVWDPSGRSVLFVPNEATGRSGKNMFEQPVFRVDLEGKTEVVSPGAVVAFSFSSSDDGSRLAFRSVGPRDAGDVVLMDARSGTTRTLTNVNPELEDLDVGPLEVLSWRSFDGMEIWGMLVTPPGYRAGTRIPLVVYVHGGPIGGFTQVSFRNSCTGPGRSSPIPSRHSLRRESPFSCPCPAGDRATASRGSKRSCAPGAREIIATSWRA